MSFDLIALKDELSALSGPRRTVDIAPQTLLRGLPIRWRLFAIAALNATVAVILAVLIWNGANVLSSAWDDVRRVRESDRLLVQLSNEASRLQSLIHRYIVAPNDQVLAEVLGLDGDVLSTLRNRGAVDPVLSGSANELRALTERFLQGFGELRALQTTISQTYENEVLKPAKDVVGLYSIIESSIESRDSLLLPSLAKSRDSFTDGLLAANAFYLAPASQAGDEARASIATVEQTIPVMIDLADSGLQRDAVSALAQGAGAFREGLKNLTEHFAARAHLLQTAIDDNQASMIALINKLSAQMGLREMRAQGSFDHTLANLYLRVALVAVVFLTLSSSLPASPSRAASFSRFGISPMPCTPSSRRNTMYPYRARKHATRSARWLGQWRCFGRMRWPSARRRASCGPPRITPKKPCKTCARRNRTSLPPKNSPPLVGLSPASRTR